MNLFYYFVILCSKNITVCAELLVCPSYIRGSTMTKRLKSTVLHSTRALISKKNKHRVVRNNKLKRSR